MTKPDVEVYAVGPLTASCCAPKAMKRAAVERAVNAQYPTGIRSRWTISKDKTFRTGEPHPKVCENDSDRRHYLLHC